MRGQENTSLILVKTRDLSQCTDRYKYMSILQTVRYDFQSVSKHFLIYLVIYWFECLTIINN